MLCLPGLTPVANDAHAVGDSGECVVVSGRTPPVDASRERFGSWPAFIQRSSSAGSMPSKPRMRSLGRATSLGAPERQADAMRPAVSTSATPDDSTRAVMRNIGVAIIRAGRTKVPPRRQERVRYSSLVRFLGIDYGHRRIGLALSDPTGLLSRPWKTIPRHGNTDSGRVDARDRGRDARGRGRRAGGRRARISAQPRRRGDRLRQRRSSGWPTPCGRRSACRSSFRMNA